MRGKPKGHTGKSKARSGLKSILASLILLFSTACGDKTEEVSIQMSLDNFQGQSALVAVISRSSDGSITAHYTSGFQNLSSFQPILNSEFPIGSNPQVVILTFENELANAEVRIVAEGSDAAGAVKQNAVQIFAGTLDSNTSSLTLVEDSNGQNEIAQAFAQSVYAAGPPLAEAGADTLDIFANVSQTFTAAESSNSAVTYAWDFGDGTTANGRSVNKTFDTAGEYIVKLTVADSVFVQTDRVTVTVASNAKPVILGNAFTATLDGVQAALVNFSVNATDADDSIVSYEWNFGNGQTSTVTTSTVSHQYQFSGQCFEVSLTVRDSRGATAQVTQEVYTGPGTTDCP